MVSLWEWWMFLICNLRAMNFSNSPGLNPLDIITRNSMGNVTKHKDELKMSNANSEVTKFLDALQHPLRPAIEQLWMIVLNADDGIIENIKWNGPNYCFENEDRITMRVHPSKQIQLIFHRGVKKLPQTKDKVIDTNSGLLVWKENDRAVAFF